MIHGDAAFRIGKTHTVCEDYAIARTDDQTARASVWLSDGCSSSPHTDIGARLLVHTAAARVGEFKAVATGEASCRVASLDGLIATIMMHAVTGVEHTGLPTDCLDATLLGLVAGDTGAVHAILYGDGAVIWGLRDGSRIVYRSRYPASFPFYPAYVGDVDRRARWERTPDNGQTLTRTVLEPDGAVCDEETSCPDEGSHLLSHSWDDLCWAAVVSDGIESFQQVGNGTGRAATSVGYLDVLRELTAFKNFRGEFARRRVRAFAKDADQRGWHHNDDLSIAALYFGDGNPTE